MLCVIFGTVGDINILSLSFLAIAIIEETLYQLMTLGLAEAYSHK